MGYVLTSQPGLTGVFAIDRDLGGHWLPPVAVALSEASRR